jgi:hypothetical protein
MPTVKIQNGKVILKDGKVSCSCCEGCCMYPAEGLGVTYEAADLPDTLWVNVGGTVDEEFTRDGSRYKNAENTLEIVNVGDSWRLQLISTSEDLDAGFEGCLITGDGNYTPGDDTVEDQFADCYEVTWNDDGARSANVTRQDLCNWTGTDNESGSVRLRYNSTTTKWEVIASLGTEAKDSNQSAPDAGAGTYGDYTVTEC